MIATNKPPAAKKKETIDYLVKELHSNFPCSYGGPNHRMKALNQLLVVNGNGYEWKDDGTTIMHAFRGPIRRDKPPFKAKQLHDQAMEKLRAMPDFEPLVVHKSYGFNEFRYGLKDDAKEAELEEWDLEFGTRTNAVKEIMATYKEGREKEREVMLDRQMYLSSVCKPPSFYTLCIERFSLVARMTDKANPDVVEAAFEVLHDGILTQEQGEGHYQTSNHAHALILLFRFKPIFKHHGIWPGDESVLNLRGRVDKERLRLSCKMHVTNHLQNENNLTNDEYAWYHSISFAGLPDDEIALLRKYTFYLRWRDGIEKQRSEESRSREFKRRKAFWHALKVEEADDGSFFQIPAQIITDEMARACMRSERMTFSI